MNTITQFTAMLKKVCNEEMPAYLTTEVTMTAVTKVNDQKLLGLTFVRENSESGITIYTEQYFARYKDGEDFESLVHEIIGLYIVTLAKNEPITKAPDLSYESIKDRLTIKVVEVERNLDYLEEIPYREIDDGLALVCDIQLSEPDENGVYRTTINNSLARSYGYDMDEVFKQAMNSSLILDPPVMVRLTETLQSEKNKSNLLDSPLPIDSEDKDPIYVLTNRSGIYGATSLFYPNVKERVMEVLGEGYYALPSSLHEFLIVPMSTKAEINELTEMVKMANQTVVEPNEVLSDKVITVTP